MCNIFLVFKVEFPFYNEVPFLRLTSLKLWRYSANQFRRLCNRVIIDMNNLSTKNAPVVRVMKQLDYNNTLCLTMWNHIKVVIGRWIICLPWCSRGSKQLLTVDRSTVLKAPKLPSKRASSATVFKTKYTALSQWCTRLCSGRMSMSFCCWRDITLAVPYWGLSSAFCPYDNTSLTLRSCSRLKKW